MKNTCLWLKSIFNATSDSPSTIRLLSWVWVLTLCGGIFFCMAFDAVTKVEVELPPIDSSYVMITAIFLGAKVGQRMWVENTSGTTPMPPTPSNPPVPPKA